MGLRMIINNNSNFSLAIVSNSISGGGAEKSMMAIHKSLLGSGVNSNLIALNRSTHPLIDFQHFSISEAAQTLGARLTSTSF